MVTKEEEVLLQVPAIKLQGAFLYGNVQVSTQCLTLLLREGIWLSFFSRNGIYKGRLQPPFERGGQLRLRQWERSRDAQHCIEFSRSVVRGKVLAQRQTAASYAKNHLAQTLGEGHRVLKQSLERLEEVQDLAELRGVEGAASRAYFGLFRRWNRSEMLFEGRSKRGATDPVNALLNFGYSLLTRELEGLLEAAGLDATIGFYHVAEGDRPSLACDWVEEFRHVVVDKLVLNLINRRTIQAGDFDDREERGGLRLTPDALRKFLRAYESVMRGAPNPSNGMMPSGVRALMLSQLAVLLDSLSGRVPYRSHLER